MSTVQNLVGKDYPAAAATITQDMGRAYAAATDDDNPHYKGDAAVLPPMVLVRVSLLFGAAPVVTDDDLIARLESLLGILHIDEDLQWFKPLKPQVILTAKPSLVAVQTRRSGVNLQVRTLLSENDQVVAEVNSTFYLIERTATGLRRDEVPPRPKPMGEPDWQTSWRVATNQSQRYAEASGDHNPIHLDNDAAKQAHLKGKILHGLCTMAFAQRAVVQHYADGDPRRLSRLRVRFSRPVYMGDELTCACVSVRQGEVNFVVRNQEKQVVLADGVATLVSSAG